MRTNNVITATDRFELSHSKTAGLLAVIGINGEIGEVFHHMTLKTIREKIAIS